MLGNNIMFDVLTYNVVVCRMYIHNYNTSYDFIMYDMCANGSIVGMWLS